MDTQHTKKNDRESLWTINQVQMIFGRKMWENSELCNEMLILIKHKMHEN